MKGFIFSYNIYYSLVQFSLLGFQFHLTRPDEYVRFLCVQVFLDLIITLGVPFQYRSWLATPGVLNTWNNYNLLQLIFEIAWYLCGIKMCEMTFTFWRGSRTFTWKRLTQHTRIKTNKCMQKCLWKNTAEENYEEPLRR